MSKTAHLCGFPCWHPSWLNRFVTVRWFMVVYGFLGTVQATSFIYFSLTMTTLQKRFKIPSETTGVILSGNEVSQIMLSLILAYFCGHKNRTKWIAWGVVFNALSCFILASPHFMYGAGDDAFQLTQEYLDTFENVSSEVLLNTTAVPLKENSKLCHTTANPDDGCVELFSYVPLAMIFMSQFVLGIGNTLYLSLGQSYLDDNTSQKRSAMVFAYALAMRMTGPIMGFVLTYFTSTVYIDPSLTPIIKYTDPRWLGAWWLGWIIIGLMMLVLAALIGMFPENLPRKVDDFDDCADDAEKSAKATLAAALNEPDEIPTWAEFTNAVMRLLKNKILMYNIMNTVFSMIGATAFMTFVSRIMEVQFNKPGATGSVIMGSMSIFGVVCGFLISGYVITKFKPPPNYLYMWNIFISTIALCATLFYSFLGCDSNNFHLINGTLQASDLSCHCDDISFTPICNIQTNETYFSPCHAGCKAFDAKQNQYTDCWCARDKAMSMGSSVATDKNSHLDKIWPLNGSSLAANYDRRDKDVHISPIYAPGACENDCDHDFMVFSFVGLFVSLLTSTGKIGSILVDLRAIHPKDKSLAQGLALFLMSLFAAIPTPIIFGRIIDSTCISWSFKCGGLGNCQLFDPVLFRTYFHRSSAAFKVVAIIFEVMLWRLSTTLNLYGEAEKPAKDAAQQSSAECEPLTK